ncbi:MAG: Gfo/Idh/MocA family protein [Pirellulales bacterium]
MSRFQRVSRREFLRTSALAGSAALAAGTLRGPVLAESKSPNEKLNIAVVGVAGRGGDNLQGVSSENIVALCDVDENRLAEAAKRFPKAKTFVDFRKMFESVEKQIDAAVVSTTDHVHAPASVMAMKMGKHCYCEKPLTHTVFEARVAAEIAKKNKLATQMGTQIHAENNYRRVVELVQSGAVGRIAEVHVWCGSNWSGGDRPKETPEVPKNIHWDLWLGPAPFRPYHPCYLPAHWRRWWDFGNGTLGDMACHYMDLPFWALDLRYPTTIEAEGPPVHPEACPSGLMVRYEFPARGDKPPVKLTWYDGPRRPPILAERKLPAWGAGVVFVGSEGILQADYGNWNLFPEAKFAKFEPPKPTIPTSIGHHQEWILACKTGSPTTCNFDYSGALAEAVLLGNVAYRSSKKLAWDPIGLKATNCPEADQYLRREYRKGWTL